ncbi:MAG TPA: S8 family serine peptidase [Telluria sp.]|nr:S8 family serine peptidase [Telluria sp.]
MKPLLAALALVPLLAMGAGTPQAPANAPAQATAAAVRPGQVMAMLHLPAPHYRADGAYSGNYASDPGRSGRRKIARELARKHGLELVDDWPMPLLGVDCYVFALPPEADPVRVAALLGSDSRVEWAQPVSAFRMLGGAAGAGDPLYAVQPVVAAWHLTELHRAATGRKTTVAVVDSGVDASHPDLAGQVSVNQNFVSGDANTAENHGTAVAGIIAARAGNGVGIRGVAPDARVLALRACRERADARAQCDSFSLAKAINFAIQRSPNVINLSLTGPSDRLLQRLLDAAMARGIRVVGAYDSNATDGGFPASWPGVLAVSDGTGRRALAAPGADIPVPMPGGRFGVQTGSSYAAAHVSGLLALLGELRPGATLDAKADTPLDACEAVGRLAPSCLCSCPVAPVAMRQP